MAMLNQFSIQYILFCLTVFFVFTTQARGEEDCNIPSYELVICAIFHNEAFFLKEWIEFHKLQGVQHFYLYNNLSTDHCTDILKPYIESGEVELFDWPIETYSQKEYFDKLQIPAYNHALSMIKKAAKWAAFIDLDEFLYPVKQDNLIDFLKDYNNYAGVGVNWQIFGTSWIDSLSENELIIENLVLKAEEKWQTNRIIKLIVQPKWVEHIPNPHFFIYKEGYFAVNSNQEPLEPGYIAQAIVIDAIRINHYWFGSTDWFIKNKLPRRTKWGIELSKDTMHGLISSCNQYKDEAILRFVPMLKEKMYGKK
jgi:hypothetical protein